MLEEVEKFLVCIADAQRSRQQVPAYPEIIEEFIALEVHYAGGLLKWALTHPYYISYCKNLDQKLQAEREQAQFLSTLIFAMIDDRSAPKPPPSLIALGLSAKEPGNLLSWARAQPTFEKLKAKALKRRMKD